MSAHRVIDDVGSFISMITFLFGTGFTAWTCHFAHSTRLKQAEKILDDVTTFVNTLTEEDKRMIDAYIAEASVRRPSETQCLLNTEQIFARLADVQDQQASISASLTGRSSFQFPWSDLAGSIYALVRECHDLKNSVETSANSALARFPGGVPSESTNTTRPLASSDHSSYSTEPSAQRRDTVQSLPPMYIGGETPLHTYPAYPASVHSRSSMVSSNTASSGVAQPAPPYQFVHPPSRQASPYSAASSIGTTSANSNVYPTSASGYSSAYTASSYGLGHAVDSQPSESTLSLSSYSPSSSSTRATAPITEADTTSSAVSLQPPAPSASSSSQWSTTNATLGYP